MRPRTDPGDYSMLAHRNPLGMRIRPFPLDLVSRIRNAKKKSLDRCPARHTIRSPWVHGTFPHPTFPISKEIT
jgi:hypothetical protein